MTSGQKQYVCLEKGSRAAWTSSSLRVMEMVACLLNTRRLDKHLFLSPQEAVKKDQGLLSFPSQLGHVGAASRSVQS